MVLVYGRSVSVSSCRCCKVVSSVHRVAVLNAAYRVTCSLLMFVEDARGDHIGEAYSMRVLMCWECVYCS